MIRIGWLELVIVVALILLIVGPGRIERGARRLGAALRSLRDRLFRGSGREE